ncbi:hypothetical protein HKD37_13G035645 [Glycine soja]
MSIIVVVGSMSAANGSGEYRCRKKEFVRRDTGTRKCGCPFKLRGKPVVGGQDTTYKTNRYRLPLLDFVGVTPTGTTFSAGFAYLEDKRLNNVVWALERSHINKNVKAKCKSLIGQRNAWEYVMDVWGTLVDCPSEQQFDECLKKFEMVCSPWPMFIDYVKKTWIIPHKEKFVTAWTNKVMHLGNTTTNRVESTH